jgi:hypothetical protein
VRLPEKLANRKNRLFCFDLHISLSTLVIWQSFRNFGLSLFDSQGLEDSVSGSYIDTFSNIDLFPKNSHIFIQFLTNSSNTLYAILCTTRIKLQKFENKIFDDT